MAKKGKKHNQKTLNKINRIYDMKRIIETYKYFIIKGVAYRFVFTTHAMGQMEKRCVNEQEVLFLFEGLKCQEMIEGFIRDGKEIILSDPKLGFSMVLDFKDALKESDSKAIKLVTVLDKTEVFAKKGTELIAI